MMNASRYNVSIHALLAECDCCIFKSSGTKIRFQSTHSLRSATYLTASDSVKSLVSIHALLAECDAVNKPSRKTKYVSIHALLAECDTVAGAPNAGKRVFQSTHSLRSATRMERTWI